MFHQLRCVIEQILSEITHPRNYGFNGYLLYNCSLYHIHVCIVPETWPVLLLTKSFPVVCRFEILLHILTLLILTPQLFIVTCLVCPFFFLSVQLSFAGFNYRVSITTNFKSPYVQNWHTYIYIAFTYLVTFREVSIFINVSPLYVF